jgi:hypothetical protein
LKFLWFQQEEEKKLLFTRLKRSRRGVGTVLGAVFVVLIIVSAFTVYEVALLNMNNYATTIAAMNQFDSSRSGEGLSILSIKTVDDNTLNITVKNVGSLQSTIIYVGIFNQSVTPESQGYFSVNHLIGTGETQSFLSPFQVTPDHKYLVQLITEGGRIFDYKLYPADQVSLDLSLIAVSPTVYQGNNITVILAVTNNSTEGITADGINLHLLDAPSDQLELLSAPDSLTVNSLAPGSSTFYTWTYTAVQTGTVYFNATYNPAPAGAHTTATVTILAQPDGASQAQVTITGTNATLQYHPTQWTLLGGTNSVNGSISDLVTNDSNKAGFTSYYTGNQAATDTYVAAGTSNVDGSQNKGALTNFAGMQTGIDGSSASLAEALSSNPTGSFGNPTAFNTGYSVVSKNAMYGSVFTSGNTATSIYNITFYGRTTSPGSVKAVICDSSGHIITNGVSATASITNKVAWYTLTFPSAPTISANTNYWLMIVSSDNSIRLYYGAAAGSGKYDSSNSYDSPHDPAASSNSYNYCLYANTSSVATYKLDYEAQWTNLNTVQQTNTLCLYLSGQTDSEALAVDVWTGGQWLILFSGLSTGWNNASISPYIASTLTLRFRDVTPFDASQSTWSIDAALIHQITPTDQYTLSVELSGTSNTNTWTQLLYNLKSQLDTSDAIVTIQLYNYAAGAYVSSGNGYTTYQSTANTANTQTCTVTSNPSDFKSDTDIWKIKVTATKITSTQFHLYLDWAEINPTYPSTGETLPYGAQQTYIITSTSSSGGATPYVYVSIYSDGSNITLLNTLTNQAISNPAWVQLDVSGVYQFKLSSNSVSEDSFVIYASVGTTVGQKNVLQEAQ